MQDIKIIDKRVPPSTTVHNVANIRYGFFYGQIKNRSGLWLRGYRAVTSLEDPCLGYIPDIIAGGAGCDWKGLQVSEYQEVIAQITVTDRPLACR